jgi:hypothetical protein
MLSVFIVMKGKGLEMAKIEPHCENCGRENPDTSDGYTVCCNETVCCGGRGEKFGIPTDYVRACCWAVADKKFKADGRKAPKGSYRLD